MKFKLTILAFSLLLVASCKNDEKTNPQDKSTPTVNSNGIQFAEQEEICFRQVVSKDTLMLTVIKKGDSISGTFRSTPYEKDKKINVFTGRLSGNTVTAVGTSIGEGSTVQEEIIFTLENNKAGIKFGEMIKGDDGVYRYKNKKSATSLYINKVECLK